RGCLPCRARGLEITLPEVDVDAPASLGAFPPQLGRVEDDRVEHLGPLAAAMCVRVGEDELLVHVLDDSSRAAHVARASGMTGGVHVGHSHGGTGPVARLPLAT